jgi:hypothetical protein
MDVPSRIDCVECGGVAHLQSYPPPEGFAAGDVITFACEDCDHRLDVVFEDGESPLE